MSKYYKVWSMEIIKEIKKLKRVKDGILIVGLPGFGFVGKFAVEFLIDKLKAKKILDIYHHSMPPQVFLGENWIVDLPKHELFYKKYNKKNIFLLTSDFQPLDGINQYELYNEIVNMAINYGIKTIITIGGKESGSFKHDYRVFGAITDKKLLKTLKKYGIIFGEEFRGPIIGGAGLLLGLAKLYGLDGIGLMGETHGQFADPRASKTVLEKLFKLIGMKLKLDELEKQAQQIEQELKKIKQVKNVDEEMIKIYREKMLRASQEKPHYIK